MLAGNYREVSFKMPLMQMPFLISVDPAAEYMICVIKTACILSSFVFSLTFGAEVY